MPADHKSWRYSDVLSYSFKARRGGANKAACPAAAGHLSYVQTQAIWLITLRPYIE